jgi:hypothetical protein
MKMKWNSSGFSETINRLSEATKEGFSCRKKAVKDVGNMIKKELSRLRRSGAGLQPLGIISKLLGHKKPWGKKKFVVYTPKKGQNPYAIVTTKGANKTMEEGGFVSISEDFRKFLHFKGVHLKKGSKAKIPPRPLFKLVWGRVSSRVPSYFGERFHYHLGRAMRKWEYKK